MGMMLVINVTLLDFFTRKVYNTYKCRRFPTATAMQLRTLTAKRKAAILAPL